MKSGLWTSLSVKSASVSSNPLDGRIQLLSSQLQGSHDSYGHKPTAPGKDFEKLEDRVKRVEAKIKETEEVHQKRIALLGDALSKFTKLLDEERKSSEAVYEEQLKKASRLEDKMAELLATIERRKAESEASVNKYLVEKTNAVWESVRAESTDRQKQIESILGQNQQTIPEFEKKLRAVANVREENDRKIMTEMNIGFEESTTLLQQERKKRDENDQASFDIVKEFVENARKEINAEKKEREKSEETFLTLMEDACSKLHALSKI